MVIQTVLGKPQLEVQLFHCHVLLELVKNVMATESLTEAICGGWAYSAAEQEMAG